MADQNQLASKVEDLEQRVSQEIRELRESVKAIQQMLELQFSVKEKGQISEAGLGCNIQKISGEEHPANHCGTAIVPKYSKLEFPSDNGTEKPLIYVEIQDPPNLAVAVNLARASERKIQFNYGSISVGRSPIAWAAPSSSTCQEKKTQGENFESAPNIGSEIVTPSIKLLTKAEMSDRRVRGRCFNCDALYSSGNIFTFYYTTRRKRKPPDWLYQSLRTSS